MGKPAATISSYHMCPDKTAKHLTSMSRGTDSAKVSIGSLSAVLIND